MSDRKAVETLPNHGLLVLDIEFLGLEPLHANPHTKKTFAVCFRKLDQVAKLFGQLWQDIDFPHRSAIWRSISRSRSTI